MKKIYLKDFQEESIDVKDCSNVIGGDGETQSKKRYCYCTGNDSDNTKNDSDGPDPCDCEWQTVSNLGGNWGQGITTSLGLGSILCF